MSQTDFGEIGKVARNAQLDYEKGKRSPDVDYLLSLAAHGVDIVYLLTGERREQVASDFTPSEVVVLRWFRAMPDAQRHAALMVLDALAQASKRQPGDPAHENKGGRS